jgi:hypothetical protein
LKNFDARSSQDRQPARRLQTRKIKSPRADGDQTILRNGRKGDFNVRIPDREDKYNDIAISRDISLADHTRVVLADHLRAGRLRRASAIARRLSTKQIFCLVREDDVERNGLELRSLRRADSRASHRSPAPVMARRDTVRPMSSSQPPFKIWKLDRAKAEGSEMKKFVDVKNIQKVLKILVPDGVFEIRCPNTIKGTIAGYFDNHKKAAIAAAELSEKVPAIYVTLNPVDPALLARSANRLTPYAKCTTTDKDIVQRRWLPLDFDAVRPAGISATDSEHQLAIDRATKARDWLTDLGFPRGILADSGNGSHLLYSVDAPNDKDAGDLIQDTIKAIAEKFSDDRVKVDLTVHNPARIWKVYGTLVCKGDDLPDRPHRMARIIDGVKL